MEYSMNKVGELSYSSFPFSSCSEGIFNPFELHLCLGKKKEGEMEEKNIQNITYDRKHSRKEKKTFC